MADGGTTDRVRRFAVAHRCRSANARKSRDVVVDSARRVRAAGTRQRARSSRAESLRPPEGPASATSTRRSGSTTCGRGCPRIRRFAATARTHWSSGCSSARSKNLLAGRHDWSRITTRTTATFAAACRCACCGATAGRTPSPLERQPAGARGETGGGVARALAHDARRPRRSSCTSPRAWTRRPRGELARLEALGCLKPNTVIVHGVAIDDDGWRRWRPTAPAFVWCPASNVFLFGRTAAIERHAPQLRRRPRHRDRHRLARSPARATCSTSCGWRGRPRRCRRPSSWRWRRGTRRTCSVSRAPAASPSACPRIVVVPPPRAVGGESVLEASRKDLQLVAIGGGPLLGDPTLPPDVFAARRVARAAADR